MRQEPFRHSPEPTPCAEPRSLRCQGQPERQRSAGCSSERACERRPLTGGAGGGARLHVGRGRVFPLPHHFGTNILAGVNCCAAARGGSDAAPLAGLGLTGVFWYWGRMQRKGEPPSLPSCAAPAHGRQAWAGWRGAFPTRTTCYPFLFVRVCRNDLDFPHREPDGAGDDGGSLRRIGRVTRAEWVPFA